MIPVLLTKVKTSDGVTLDGIYVRPKRRSDAALIWIHGLTSYFHSGQTLVKELSSRCRNARIGYFKFDNRGHDLVSRGQGSRALFGTLFERFEDCIHDIRATIGLARRLGYKKIILAGHSTGANKAVYYLYKIKDRNITGLMLVGALNDISAEKTRVGVKKFNEAMRLAKKLYQKNPNSFFISNKFLWTARRFLSAHTPGTAEDVFPYYNLKANWRAYKNIKTPTAFLIGSRDEYSDRSAQELISIFKKHSRAKSFSGFVIKGAGHSFVKKERGLADVIVKWIKSLHGNGHK